MDVWLPDGAKDLTADSTLPLASKWDGSVLRALTAQRKLTIESLICSLVMIHGGGFTIGSSSDVPVNQIKHYLENDIAVVSLEYRMLPQ